MPRPNDHKLETFRTENGWYWVSVCSKCGKVVSGITSQGQTEIRFTTVHGWGCK